MLVCAICGSALGVASPCRTTHPDHCHGCASLNLSSGWETQPHPAPRETPLLALTQRELAAVSAYQRRVLALEEGEA